ncbi:hypothetical protein DMA11_01135 [Marinilabiliaceae bacterium JC017]|nr:hypothetical protein DMA11_01135 [Marinilabiliaceae bacterium JC017]
MDKRLKLFLYTGILFLTAGIISRTSGITGLLPILFFSFGGSLKAIYLFLGVKTGHYKTGSELILLPIGILLVVTSIFFKRNDYFTHISGWMLSIGIAFKLLFLYLFFRRNIRKKAIAKD